jgi:hypothetical protein
MKRLKASKNQDKRTVVTQRMPLQVVALGFSLCSEHISGGLCSERTSGGFFL